MRECGNTYANNLCTTWDLIKKFKVILGTKMSIHD